MQKEADKEEERELTPDEMGRKIASQWTTDPDAAGSGDSSADDTGAMQEEGEAEDTGSGTAEADDVSLCVHVYCCSAPLQNSASGNLGLMSLAMLYVTSCHVIIEDNLYKHITSHAGPLFPSGVKLHSSPCTHVNQKWSCVHIFDVSRDGMYMSY